MGEPGGMSEPVPNLERQTQLVCILDVSLEQPCDSTDRGQDILAPKYSSITNVRDVFWRAPWM